MNKIVEIIRGNPEYRWFATTVIIADKYYNASLGYDIPAGKLQDLYEYSMALAAIDEISISRTEIMIKISPAFEGEDGWSVIRAYMLPKIKELFYEDVEPDYELRDDRHHYISRGEY